ncbi:TniQ family protein [Vibrio europaeus]|uniref:TniQ family protein n=1 Tax=Vibrio europaeus TaxID=300876 RepID=UPI00233EF8D5|nr:TniQ family protein [Vibrio europaeus]MDC5821891.1 TniQ family protein [Vibrio europaeus]
MANVLSRPWPAHPQPLPDELFSSWMTRAARCNGQKLRSFCSMTMPGLKNLAKSIDSFVSPENLVRVSVKMKTSTDSAYQTTLESYSGVLFERASIRTRHKQNILSVGETHNHLFYQQYCPLCLLESEPYYRRTWRISFVTVCVRHRCVLHDRCVNCGAPVMVMANDVRRKNRAYEGQFTDCHCCGTDLKMVVIASADCGVIEDTKQYLDICRKGYFLMPSGKWVYAFSFFTALRHMIRVFVERQPDVSDRLVDPDCLPLNLRYSAMVDISGIFTDWPKSFIDYCNINKIRYSSITPMAKTSNGRVPYWFDEESKPALYSKNKEPSEESVQYAMAIMQNMGKKINVTSVNRFMGYRDSRVVAKVVQKLEI